jgi:large conductance mechanosensitive channel
MKKTLDEFQKFIMRGNVMDMAIGVIIGGAFGKIVTSLVNDIIMPPIGLLVGKVDFTNLFISLNGQHYASLSAAQKAGAPTLNYGVFLNTTINFIIMAFCIFFMIKQVTLIQKRLEKPVPPTGTPNTKECPYCYSAISVKATRCAYCAADLLTAKV